MATILEALKYCFPLVKLDIVIFYLIKFNVYEVQLGLSQTDWWAIVWQPLFLGKMYSPNQLLSCCW